MEGAGELRLHTFSGFDFAKLVRNFEITAGSTSETGQIRATAALIYLAPALVINAAVLNLLEVPAGISKRVAAASAVAAGGYGLLVLVATFFLSVVHVNDFADVVGTPRYGFLISAMGSGLILCLGLAGVRRSGSPHTQRSLT